MEFTKGKKKKNKKLKKKKNNNNKEQRCSYRKDTGTHKRQKKQQRTNVCNLTKTSKS